ncbi:universal stress protein [bacterium]|nr:universal stress protein [bacterium]
MKILIPVEDKQFAHVIAEFVCNHTWPKEVEFRILNVYESVFLQEVVSPLAMQQLEEASQLSQSLGRMLMMDVGTKLRLKFPHSKIEEILKEGDPKQIILNTIKLWQPDFVVMGAHGKGSIERFFLGSVSLAVLSHAPCSVVTIKIPTPSE